MADPFQPVRQGQPIELSARSFNGALKAGQDYSRRKLGDARTEAGADRLLPQIRNDTGDALDAFSVLGFGDFLVSPANTPFDAAAQPVFASAAPAVDAPFCITTEPLPSGTLGGIVIAGPAVVKVSVSDASHTRAIVSAGVTGYLVSAPSGGIPILRKETGTGMKWAQVLIGPITVVSRGAVNLIGTAAAGVAAGAVNVLPSADFDLLIPAAVAGACEVTGIAAASFARTDVDNQPDAISCLASVVALDGSRNVIATLGTGLVFSGTKHHFQTTSGGTLVVGVSAGWPWTYIPVPGYALLRNLDSPTVPEGTTFSAVGASAAIPMVDVNLTNGMLDSTGLIRGQVPFRLSNLSALLDTSAGLRLAWRFTIASLRGGTFQVLGGGAASELGCGTSLAYRD